MTTVGERIAARLKDMEQSQSWLARQVGMKPQGIQSIISGDVARPKRLREIAATLKTSQEFLLGETDTVKPSVRELTRVLDADHGKRAVSSERRVGIARGEIPQIAGGLGAGVRQNTEEISVPVGRHGNEVGARVLGTWQIPATVLQRRIRSGIDQLHFMECEGDSMEPDIKDGDVVLIDQSRRNPRMPGIFALYEGDGMTLKRVEVVHGPDPIRLRLIPANPSYSSYEVLADEVNLIGRYVARFTVD